MPPMPPPKQPAMPPAQAAPAMPPAQSGGPGLMGTFASSAAGSVAGSMIGNALMGGMGRGGGEAPPQVSEAAAAAQAGPACSFESQQFLQCMTNTKTTSSSARPSTTCSSSA